MLVDNVGGVASMWHVKRNGVTIDTGLHYISIKWSLPVKHTQGMFDW